MLASLLWMVTCFKNDTTQAESDDKGAAENWGGLSVVLHILLPMAGLILFFKQKHILSRLLLQLDRNCVSVLCPSFSKREKLLKWAGSRLPLTWSSQSKTLSGGVSELWSDGSLLCTLINSVIPGACPNPHRHWKKPPLHAQAIAFKYLGVVPIFTENDLSGNLTANFERTFLHYLNELQQAINQLSDKNEVFKSISTQYIARGMGLYSGEQHRKTVFYVYPDQKYTKCATSNVIIQIRGPYGTFGKAVIPNMPSNIFTTPEVNITSDLFSKQQILQKKYVKSNNSFIRTLSFSFIKYHKKHMGDNIVIDVTLEKDRAKITYIPRNYGMYEINLISNGELISGCPFNVHILNNTSGIEDNFDENDEKVEDIPHITRRKVISKTIDFVDEEIPLVEMLKRYKSEEENVKEKEEPPKSLVKSKFNFREVVEEITKNCAIFEKMNDGVDLNNFTNLEKVKNNTDYDEIDSSTSSNTEYYQTEPYMRKIDEEIEDNHFVSEISININQQLNDAVTENAPTNIVQEDNIIEKQNCESVNEKLTNRKQEIVNDKLENKTVEKIYESNNGKNYHTFVQSNDINSNNQEYESKLINNGKIIDNDKNKEYSIDNIDGNNHSILTFNEYPRKLNVNKLRIPEKFCEMQNILDKQTVTGLSTKYFKNVINNSNKMESPKNLQNLALTVELQSPVRTFKSTLLQKNNLDSTISESNDFGDFNNNDITDSLKQNETKRKIIKTLSRKDSYRDAEKMTAVPRRFLESQDTPEVKIKPLSLPNKTLNTSPICPDHIVPEVEKVDRQLRQMSVAERRKIFAKKSLANVSSSTSSLFSEKENEECSQNKDNCKKFQGLSVLNVLGSLKKSQNTINSLNYSLSTTTSLPNIPFEDPDIIFQNSVKERKNFWEKISSSSSSLSTSLQTSPKRSKKLTEDERIRLIWKKPNEEVISSRKVESFENENKFLEKNSDICKSADDILSMTNYNSYQSPKKYKSLDNSLDNCTMLSIEERKKMLLKQNYEKEMIVKEKMIPIKNNSFKKNYGKNMKQISEEKNMDKDENTHFSPVLDKIKQYDSASTLTNTKEEEKVESNNKKNKNTPTKDISKAYIHNDLQDLLHSEKKSIKSHFKRAIKYFKNLEEKALGKTKLKPAKDYRRYSLDIHTTKVRTNKRGGSLSLRSVSERFSINNLYEDVFGNNSGSFRGAANRTALVEALATFSRRENNFSEEDEDDIKFSMFKKKAKSKKRKDVRSFFDVYY